MIRIHTIYYEPKPRRWTVTAWWQTPDCTFAVTRSGSRWFYAVLRSLRALVQYRIWRVNA